jgi:hypothetical protein
VVIALFIILLTENSRVPVDDPATHLELTMIHEVMVLDHSGPDFAFIELGCLFQALFLRRPGYPPDLPVSPGHPAIQSGPCLFPVSCAGLCGRRGDRIVMARYRMDKVPKFVLTSFALAFFATVITLEFSNDSNGRYDFGTGPAFGPVLFRLQPTARPDQGHCLSGGGGIIVPSFHGAHHVRRRHVVYHRDPG